MRRGRCLSVARHATRGLLLAVLRIGLSLLLVVAVSVVDDSDTDEDIGDEDTREATDLIDEVLVAVDGRPSPPASKVEVIEK